MSSQPGTALDAEAREARLVTALGRARRGGRFSLTEQTLFIAGGLLAVAGFAFIIGGWVGTSRTILVAGQIPYVVSGGLLGLAMVFFGGFLYFGYWVAVLVRDGRERAMSERGDFAELRAAIGEVSRSLETVARLLEASASAGPRGSAGPSGADDGLAASPVSARRR